jgi:UDP-N-acetylglucosamine--N-acetylmuramyl-(pentapeptide) pyrophosphoryl-undecaprenol N-acetylglucosamine transferase
MTDDPAPLILLAAGGTGGHVFPAEALASELQSRGVRLALVTDRRGGAYGGTLGGLETHRISAGGFAGKGLVGKLAGLRDVTFGLFQARALVKRLAPRVVVGFGGYASLPTVLAAGLLSIPTAIHEQNAVLGRAEGSPSSPVPIPMWHTYRHPSDRD